MSRERRKEVYKLYAVKDLLELEDKPDRWIIKNMIPKMGRVLVYGYGSTYKSALLFDVALSVASGSKFLERLPVIEAFGPALVLSTEGSIYSNKDRLLAYMRSRNLVPDSVQLFYGQQPLTLKTPEGAGALRRILETVRPIMTVIDPMVSFYGGNENDSEEMAKFVTAIDDIVADLETTIIIIHHSNKLGDLRGSTVLQGWADSVIKFEVAREQVIPGVQEKKDIISVKCEKQRDGQMGNLFSAVPFFDAQLKMTMFGLYDGVDAAGVIITQLKLQVLTYLKRSGASVTMSSLAKTFMVGHDKMCAVLEWLERDRLIEPSSIGCSTGNGRMRTVQGYRASGAGSRIDAARAILRATKEDSDNNADRR